MNINAILIFASLLLVGCSRFHSVQVEGIGKDQRKTVVTVYTVWDSKSELAKLRATTTDKTQGLVLSGLDQSSSSSNTVELIRATAEGVVRGLK